MQAKRDPSRRERYDRLAMENVLSWVKTNPGAATHTVPYGTAFQWHLFLAMNCQATIIQSLRDKAAPENVSTRGNGVLRS
jgi:hypothetical protein